MLQAYIFVMSIAELGRPGEALEWIRKLDASGSRVPGLVAAARSLLEGRGEDAAGTLEGFASTVGAIDPEALFYTARHLAHVGRPDLAMPMIGRVVETVTQRQSCYTAALMRVTFDMRPSTELGTTLSPSTGRKRLGRKRAGRVGVCVLER